MTNIKQNAKPQYVIRSERTGRYWQTSKGFISETAVDATKYDTAQEAGMVVGFCCRDSAQLVRV